MQKAHAFVPRAVLTTGKTNARKICARTAKNSATPKSAAQGSLRRHAPHVAQVRTKRPEHSIVQSTNARHARANSDQKATTISTARRAQCDSCKLSGHISDVCTFRECYNVEIDFLNVLLLSRGRHTIDDYFETLEVIVRPNDLRIEGKFLEFTDWTHVARRFPLSDRQVLELKSVAHAYKRTSSREYDRTKRELDHPSNAPIHFEFPTHQAQPDGTLRPTIYAQDIPMCPLCLTWKFPQEMGRAKWCCRGGELIDVIAPWTQPTPEFRALCLDNSRAAIEFRASSRKYNNEVSFGSNGINYGATKNLPVPSFF